MKTSQIRIIGGQWRSRRIQFAPVAGLRPSADAVRETLFNWLPHDLHQKTCLDLFAGSGAFGFEAASRGAARVVLVESNPAAVKMLRLNRQKLQAEQRVEISPMAVERFIQRPRGGFDIIFMDPPFASAIIATTCENLQAHGFLNLDARVYIESKHGDCPLSIPPSWHIIREKRCGMVQSTLLQPDPQPDLAMNTASSP